MKSFQKKSKEKDYGSYGHGDTAIFNAVRNGASGIVSEIIRNNPSAMNYREDGTGETPLHMAIRFNHIDIAKDILNLIKDHQVKDIIDIGDYAGNTPLHEAVCSVLARKKLINEVYSPDFEQCFTNLMQTLIVMGADITLKNKEGKTALDLIWEKDHSLFHPFLCSYLQQADIDIEILKKILSYQSPKLDKVDADGNTILHLVVQRNNLQILRIILANTKGTSLGHKAALKGNEKLISFLLNYNNMSENLYEHPFTRENAELYYTQIVKYLDQFNDGKKILNLISKVSAGNVNYEQAKNIWDHFLSDKGKTEVIKMLDIPAERKFQLSKLFTSAPEPTETTLDKEDSNPYIWILDNFSPYNEEDSPRHYENLIQSDEENITLYCETTNNNNNNNNLSLLDAAKLRDWDRVKNLIENGYESINKKNHRHETVLHFAVQWPCNFEVVQYLIAKGANINQQDKNGYSALYYAASDGHFKVMQYLIDKGADIHQRDGLGRTILYATPKLKVVKYLIDKGADIHHKDNFGGTILHCFANYGHPETVKFLIDKGVDIHHKSKSGETALHAAACYGWFKSVEYLVAAGVDINQQNKKNGYTALHWAADRKHFKIVKYLFAQGADVNITNNENKTAYMIVSEHKNTGNEKREIAAYLKLCSLEINEAQSKNAPIKCWRNNFSFFISSIDPDTAPPVYESIPLQNNSQLSISK